MSVRQVGSRKNIPLAGIRFIQGEREGQRDVVNVSYGEPTSRMTRNLSSGQFEHCVSKRVVEATRAVQHARVQNDDANTITYRIKCFLFRKSFRLVVEQL